MEIELKLRFRNEDGAKKFMADEEILKRAENFEKIDIQAEYLDTKDWDLMKNHLALRKRKEGNKLFATVKNKGTQVNGLSSREEYNIEISKDFNDFKEFLSKPIGKKIERILENKEIRTVVKTNYTRNKFTLNIFGCLAEVGVDNGEIIAGGKRETINEVEIEYISGDKEGVKKIGEFFQARHSLSIGNLSKYERGVALIY